MWVVVSSGNVKTRMTLANFRQLSECVYYIRKTGWERVRAVNVPVAVPQDRPAVPTNKLPACISSFTRARKHTQNVQAIVSGQGVGSVQAHAYLPGRGAARPARVLGHQQGSAADAQRNGKGGRIGMKIFKASAMLLSKHTRPNGARPQQIFDNPRGCPPFSRPATPSAPCTFAGPVPCALCRPGFCLFCVRRPLRLF